MQHLPRSSASTTRKPVPTSNNTPASPLSTQLPSPPPIPQSEPTTAAAAAATPVAGGGLKKSKSVRAKRALKSIANPIKSRREEKARRNEVETAERRENEKNVQDFLVAGRDYCERNFS